MNCKHGAEVMVLNVGRLTGLGVGVSRNTPHIGALARPEMPHTKTWIEATSQYRER